MNFIYILLVISIVLISITYNLYITIKKIKYKRQLGNDIRHKNAYYKFVSTMFLKGLPK
jgi:hypothetical protein